MQALTSGAMECDRDPTMEPVDHMLLATETIRFDDELSVDTTNDVHVSGAIIGSHRELHDSAIQSHGSE